MQQYLELMSKILDEGEPHDDRTGVGTLSLFGESLTFSLNDGKTFPLLTTKEVPLRVVFEELMWFLSGSDNIYRLRDKGVKIWDENYNAPYWQKSKYFDPGSVGRNYGQQWRFWKSDTAWNMASSTIDQIERLLLSLYHDPFSRRHVVSAWNPDEIERTVLPPCHILFQVKVHPDLSMSMAVYLRSWDYFLGAPFNIASYSLLLLLMCRVLKRKAHHITFFAGDVHIYKFHKWAVETQLSRMPLILPQVWIPELEDVSLLGALLQYKWDHIELQGYRPHPAIHAPMAV